tara:strand:- start:249 stop:383 length:135 start_codon:yes stop_codon:yes gene_type:complete
LTGTGKQANGRVIIGHSQEDFFDVRLFAFVSALYGSAHDQALTV